MQMACSHIEGRQAIYFSRDQLSFGENPATPSYPEVRLRNTAFPVGLGPSGKNMSQMGIARAAKNLRARSCHRRDPCAPQLIAGIHRRPKARPARPGIQKFCIADLNSGAPQRCSGYILCLFVIPIFARKKRARSRTAGSRKLFGRECLTPFLLGL